LKAKIKTIWAEKENKEINLQILKISSLILMQ
jgi:hypothetical protein